jgi:hypothetical protein
MRVISALWLLLTAAICCESAFAETLVLQGKPVVVDKVVTVGDFKGGLKPIDPNGNSPFLAVSQLVWWEVNYVLLRFDLDRLPKGKRVKRAQLQIFVAKLEGSPTKIRLCTVAPYDDWDEGSATWTNRNAGQTWSFGEIHRSFWKVVGSQLIDRSGKWFSWDVTDVVAEWYYGKTVNNGFLLQPDYTIVHWGDLTNSPGKVVFYSSEAEQTDLSPKLVVELTTFPPNERPPRYLPAPKSPRDLLRMPKPPYIIWYQCPYPDEVKHWNVDASVGNIKWAFENHYRGVASLMWAYGPNAPAEVAKSVGWFENQFASIAQLGYAGAAVDEWNVPDSHELVPYFVEGLRRAKKRFPNLFIAVWVTQPTSTFISLMKDNIIDLAIIQGYTHVPEHPEWAIGWDELIRHRVELMKRERLLHKTIVCLGWVLAAPDSKGNRMTAEELSRQVEYLAKNYPEMPGIAFYGGYTQVGDEIIALGKKLRDEKSESRKLVILADKLAAKWYLQRQDQMLRRGESWQRDERQEMSRKR